MRKKRRKINNYKTETDRNKIEYCFQKCFSMFFSNVLHLTMTKGKNHFSIIKLQSCFRFAIITLFYFLYFIYISKTI